jgi:hypothetical protein
MVSAIFDQFVYLVAGKLIPDRKVLIDGWHIVIGRGHNLLWTENFQSPVLNSFKGLWTGHFMNEVFVDVKN